MKSTFNKVIFTLTLAVVLAACGGGDSVGGNGVNDTVARQGVVTPLVTVEIPVAIPVVLSELEKALQNGDATALNDAKLIAQNAQLIWGKSALEKIKVTKNIYAGVSSEYDPTDYSQLIEPANWETAQPIIVGDKKGILASISYANDGRAAGYGGDVLHLFRENMLASHIPAFKRVLSWLTKGDPNAVLPSKLKIVFAGMLNVSESIKSFKKIGIEVESIQCTLLPESNCFSGADLVVMGGNWPESTKGLKNRVRRVLMSGMPILYVHIRNWSNSSLEAEILEGMDLRFGEYGGNFWGKDKVAAGRSFEENSQQVASKINSVLALMDKLVSDTSSMPYDWSKCVSDDCSKVSDLNEKLLEPLNSIKYQIDRYNKLGLNIFLQPNTNMLRHLVLWADVTRKQISYPLDKKATPAAFEKSMMADALVPYVRPVATAQTDLGTFANPSIHSLGTTQVNEEINVGVSTKEGFTAVGRMAAPGKAFTVELLDSGSAIVSLRLNTQRQGTTKLWADKKYDRPRYLASPSIPLSVNEKVQLSSPYGGTLQLQFSNATPGQQVKLRIQGMGRHPFIDYTSGTPDPTAFGLALNDVTQNWAEVKLDGFEIHSKADKMRKVISNDYKGNVTQFINEIKTLVQEDLYQLAGYKLPGKTLTLNVQATCTKFLWDCTDAKIHALPSLQHVNVDSYAQCGGGCAGNPYDQTWGFIPRGWGESHEIGHGLQKEQLNIYGDISGEVSNNVFPMHKNWRMFNEKLTTDAGNQNAYRSVFDKLKAARGEADQIEGAYRRIWQDTAYAALNSERVNFYIQWVHYLADLKSGPADTALEKAARGWDIVPLLYLHQRQFEALTDSTWATHRQKLGYSQYANKPKVEGNDNMLIALSWITERDQRLTFDLWGVRYSKVAADQVKSFKFDAEPAFLYLNSSENDHSTVKKFDPSVVAVEWKWPF